MLPKEDSGFKDLKMVDSYNEKDMDKSLDDFSKSSLMDGFQSKGSAKDNVGGDEMESMMECGHKKK